MICIKSLSEVVYIGCGWISRKKNKHPGHILPQNEKKNVRNYIMRLENEVYVWFFALLHYFFDSQAYFSAHMNCIKLKT